MPFSADVIADINASALKEYQKKNTVLSQNIQNKPLLKAFNEAKGKFSGGNSLIISRAVDTGQGGGAWQGYSDADQVNYYNPTGTKRAEYTGKEHHIGLGISESELKQGGIEVVEKESGRSDVNRVSGSEAARLVDILETKYRRLYEDADVSKNALLWGDGSADPKSLAGVRSLILDNPRAGETGGLSRVLYPWWRNRAATAAHAAAGGQGAITSSATGGGALIMFLDTELRQLKRYGSGSTKWKWFAGSAWIDAYKAELRANGNTAQDFAYNDKVPDGSMKDPRHGGNVIMYDPTLDDLGLTKRCYVIAIGEDDIQLQYFNNEEMVRRHPVRPYDRYVMYNGFTFTAALTAFRLRTSGVYDIA